MLSFIFKLEFECSKTESRKIGIGNISLADGVKFPPHHSHKSGLEVDIRPIRKDGLAKPVSCLDEASRSGAAYRGRWASSKCSTKTIQQESPLQGRGEPRRATAKYLHKWRYPVFMSEETMAIAMEERNSLEKGSK